MFAGIFWAFAFLVVAAGQALAAVLRVPEDYARIYEAVDAAASGDSVLVGPGTWTETDVRQVNIDGVLMTIESVGFLKPGISVISTDGSEVTILDGGPEDICSVVTLVHGTTVSSEPVLVRGFTITGGGNAVLAVVTSPLQLENCGIIGNPEVGIASRDVDLTLVRCLISGNEHDPGVGFTMGAVYGWDISLECVDCTFERNTGSAVYVEEASNVTLRGCLVADHDRRGAALIDVQNLEIANCAFLRNSISPAGGGALSLYNCTGGISFSVFAFDSSGGGGALELTYSSVRVENNTFYRCHGEANAGAAAIGGNDIFANNIVARSTGQRGALYISGGAEPHPESGCNVFWDNEGGDYYGNWTPPPTDVHADPQFCDEASGDYSLHSSSPAAPENSGGCGLIGAFEVDCGPISVRTTSWGRIKNEYR